MTKYIPEAVLAQHIAILGKTRSGKTNSAKLLIEQVVAAGSRVCVIDPIKADYWGLTSSADGKKAGLPFHIIGGAHGHVPLHASAGAALAGVVASGALRLSIIDMEQFGPRESGPFFAAFMESIFRNMKGVLYLVVDEAHLFAPKEGRGGDESMATYWFKRMASGSGSKGVRLVVSTQRVQELHNTVLSNCDTVIAHRVTFPEDQKRISDWVASHASKDVLAEVKQSLPNLKRGEAWICSGEANIFERRQMPLCSTYDNSRTPTEGDRRREVKTAAINQSELRTIVGDAVKEAEANDPKTLKAEIAKLKTELTKKAAPVAAKVERVEVPVLKDAQVKRLETLGKAVLDAVAKYETKMAEFTTAAREITHLSIFQKPTPKAFTREVRISAPPNPKKVYQEGKENSAPAEGLNRAQQRIVDALAWYESIGNRRPTLTQLGAVALIDPAGGYFSNTVGPLTSGGLVNRGNGTIELTDAGRAVANPLEDVGTLTDYHDVLKRRIGKMKTANGKTIAILDAVIAAGPGSETTIADIGETVGIDHMGGYFSNSIGPLSTAGVIERSGGVVRPTDVLFPEGLA